MANSRIRTLLLMLLAALCLSCGSGVKGTYSDRSGAIMLELKSDHQATFTFAGDVTACTYTVDGPKIALVCQGEKTEFTIHDDGSLTGPPGNLMGVLKKTKS